MFNHSIDPFIQTFEFISYQDKYVHQFINLYLCIYVDVHTPSPSKMEQKIQRSSFAGKMLGDPPQGSADKWIMLTMVTIQTSTNWCILVAKLNIPNGLNHHLQHLQQPTAFLIQNDRLPPDLFIPSHSYSYIFMIK